MCLRGRAVFFWGGGSICGGGGSICGGSIVSMYLGGGLYLWGGLYLQGGSNRGITVVIFSGTTSKVTKMFQRVAYEVGAFDGIIGYVDGPTIKFSSPLSHLEWIVNINRTLALAATHCISSCSCVYICHQWNLSSVMKSVMKSVTSEKYQVYLPY